jgi:hypothetical protein
VVDDQHRAKTGWFVSRVLKPFLSLGGSRKEVRRSSHGALEPLP